MESDGLGAAAGGGEALASLVKSAVLQVTEGRGIFLQQEAPMVRALPGLRLIVRGTIEHVFVVRKEVKGKFHSLTFSRGL